MSAASRPTSKDVARAAGVSQAAVSLVLGGKWPGRVSAATAERVREAARSLGYRPNLAARDLRTGRTRTALLVVPALTNEFFARVHAGAASVAAAHGFGVLLYPSLEGTGPATDPFASAPAALDGVLASSMAAQALSGIGAGALPLVMLDSDPATGPGTATVNLAIADGMRQAAGHLLGLGHRDLVHLAADVDSWTFEVRAAALAASVAAVPGARLRTRRCALGVAEAQAAVTALLAAGACKAARRLGVRVPGELSVTGFDDLTLATAIEPELTTVTLPAEEFGARGMAALLTAVDGGTPADEELPVTLTVRGSTGPAPART
ncbi:LacI family transcriptional regulator [Streptomyces albidoflavus]|uniref:LacI family DNA-binding transcriptional regulator n=1 Tax=Streptomyces albidoflavus TaxID=1886 RepID=UPI003C2B7931|nr:LacI family transcriptional regulator [Streptomyces albidoflavus]